MELLRTDILFPLIIILGVVVILFLAGILYIISMNRKNKASSNVTAIDEGQEQLHNEDIDFEEDRDVENFMEVKVLGGNRKSKRRRTHYMPPEKETAG